MTKPWTRKDDIEFRELLAAKGSSADYWQAEAMHRSEMWKLARAEAERYRRVLFATVAAAAGFAMAAMTLGVMWLTK